MTIVTRLQSWLRCALSRTRLEAEMDTEIYFHIENYAADLMQTGLSQEEAQRRARLEFGNVEL